MIFNREASLAMDKTARTAFVGEARVIPDRKDVLPPHKEADMVVWVTRRLGWLGCRADIEAKPTWRPC